MFLASADIICCYNGEVKPCVPQISPWSQNELEGYGNDLAGILRPIGMRALKLGRGHRRIIWLVLILGLIVLVSYRYVDFPFASGALTKEWARAKKNGIALESKDLLPSPPVQDSENAAVELIPLASQIKTAVDSAKPADIPPGTSDVNKNFAQNRRLYDAVKPLFGQIDQALKKPRYYVARDYDLSFEVLFPEFASYKSISKAYAHSAVLKARRGDVSGAIRDLKSGLKLAELISQDESLIAFLVAQAIYAIEMTGAHKVCEELAGSEPAIRRVRKEVVESAAYPNDFGHAIRVEMAWGIYMLRNTERYGGIWKMTKSIANLGSGNGDDTTINKKAPIVRTGLPKGMIARSFASEGLRYWNDVIESKEWQNKDWEALAAFMDKKADAESFSKTRKLSHIANDVLLPVFAQAGMTITKAEARKRVTRSMLLVLEYRARTGRFPASLAEAHADAEDPFLKGQKLHYATDGKSARIWSVNTDKKDDGGDPKKQDDFVVISPPIK